MVNNNELKEYAIKCYKGISGYSLEKAAKLFPKEFPKVLMYYNQYVYNDTMKIAERMRVVAFVSQGAQAMQTITKLMEQDAKYAKKILKYNYYMDAVKTINEFRLFKIGLKRFYETKMKNYLTSSIKLLDGIKSFANQYGFTSILKDAKNLEIDYMNQLNEINEFLKPRRDNDNG